MFVMLLLTTSLSLRGCRTHRLLYRNTSIISGVVRIVFDLVFQSCSSICLLCGDLILLSSCTLSFSSIAQKYFKKSEF